MNLLRRHAPPLTAVLLLLLLFALPSLIYPFGRDQGIHAQVGAAWLDGRLPYRDVWHPKGFLSFLPHALATALFGRQMIGIRIIDLFWQFGSGLLIFHIGRRLMSQRGALLAVALYYLVYYAFGYWHTAQPEGFLTPIVLLALHLYTKSKTHPNYPITNHPITNQPLNQSTNYPITNHHSPNYPITQLPLFLSGLTIALAPWFKQTAAVFVAALLLWAVYDWRRSRLTTSNAAVLITGIIAANLAILLFTAVTGMLAPMLEAFSYALFEYPAIDQATLLQMAGLTGSWGIWYPALIFPFLAGLAYIFHNRPLRPPWFGVIIMALAGLAGIYIQRRLWIYHWVSTLPYLVLIGAFSIKAAFSFLQSLDHKKQQAVVWLAAFACLSMVWPILSRHLSYYIDAGSYLTGRTTRAEYLQDHDLLDVVQTAQYLSSHTNENQPIFVWGHYAMIYYLSGRSNPTRFSNDPPLSLPHRRLEQWRQETAAALTAAPPAYIVIATSDTTGFEQLTSEQQLSAFDALDLLLAQHYQLETTIGGFELYQLEEG